MQANFRHPGYTFIESYEEGIPSCRKSLARCVAAYARFLRSEAGVETSLPVDVDRIYQTFGIRQGSLQVHEQLVGMEGFAADRLGLVFISTEGPEARQRFTKAHELVEYLITALQGNAYNHVLRNYIEGSKKEKLCEWGAAALLMPRQSFIPDVNEMDVSLASASELAGRYQTSLLATLYGIVEHHAAQDTALIVWHHAHRKAERERLAADNQASLFDDAYRSTIPLAVRVWWTAFPRHLRIVARALRNKSTPDDSLVGRVFADRLPRQGREIVKLVKLRGECFVDAVAAEIDNKPCVISLFRLPASYAADQPRSGLLFDHVTGAG